MTSLKRFQRLEEEHGELNTSSKKKFNENVQRRYTTFYLVLGLLHIIVLAFSIVFYVVGPEIGEAFGICVQDSNILNNYDLSFFFDSSNNNNTGAVTIGQYGNFTCTTEYSDGLLYVISTSCSLCTVVFGAAVHRILPVGHIAIKYSDSIILMIVYMVNMFGPFFAVFDSHASRGGIYAIPSLLGARVGLPC